MNEGGRGNYRCKLLDVLAAADISSMAFSPLSTVNKKIVVRKPFELGT